MIEVGRTIVSKSVFEEEFVCNISKCKGACCIEGDAGAPLTVEETQLLDEIYPKIKPFLEKSGREAIEQQGTYTIDPSDGEPVTPLVNHKECAYAIFEKNGTVSCGIEKAYQAKAINFKKPISCHLYPIRITRYKKFDAVNYHQWNICHDACTLGKALKVKVYQFLKEPLIRTYGKEWYQQLEIIDKEYFSKEKKL